MAKVHVGCSGFNYRHWLGNFYPDGLQQRKWLSHYFSVFSSVELNVTFYRLPPASTFRKWLEETPADFVFCIKGSRFITHIKRMRDTEEPLERFYKSALELGKKLGAVLWQFPPGFTVDNRRLSLFLAQLGRYKVRNTLEFRDESWLNTETISLCRDHNIPLCMADWPEFLADPPASGDFVYIRRHGRHGDYATDYSTEELHNDASLIADYLKKEKDVFVYFNNDARGYAPRNAMELEMMFSR